MFSQTSEYAIRAMIAIARLDGGGFAESHVLASRLGIPRHYLAKILQQLARSGLLDSARGRTGGFRLVRSADEIMLHEIVAPFEDRRQTARCILGEPECGDEAGCPLHAMWTEVRGRYLAELETRSLADLANFDPLAATIPCLAGLMREIPESATMGA